MWATPPEFLTALNGPHKLVTIVTVTTPDGNPVTLTLDRDSRSSITVDSTARTRRKASLGIIGTKQVYDLISTDGALFKIMHGIDLGGSNQILIPVFCGELVEGSQELGNQSIDCSLVDLNQWIVRTNYLSPFSPSPSITRKQAISDAVTSARPGTLINITATGSGLVGEGVWSSRSDLISDLALAGGMEAFFLPDGSFLIRDQLTTTTTAVYTIQAGFGGTLKSANRARPKAKLYNTVVVRPSGTDQTWTQQVAQVSDITSPRHPSRIGIVPLILTPPGVTDYSAAMAIALRKLDQIQGTTETLSLGAISNPALEGSDVIRAITPTINESPAQIFQHFIDSYSLDLIGGGMTLDTRSQVVTDG